MSRTIRNYTVSVNKNLSVVKAQSMKACAEQAEKEFNYKSIAELRQDYMLPSNDTKTDEEAADELVSTGFNDWYANMLGIKY